MTNFLNRFSSHSWRGIPVRLFWSISADRILATAGSVAFFSLLAVFPGIAALVSLYGLFAEASTISNHLALLSGIFPAGVISLISDQIIRIAENGNKTLGWTFLVTLLFALYSANSGVAALFDALNIVYRQKEKRSLLRFYFITFLSTILGIIVVLLAIMGVVILPLVFKFIGLPRTTEWLLAILRWPILFVAVAASLAFVYRFGPSRTNARWRWVTSGSIVAAFCWIAASMLFSWYVATFDSYNRIYGSLGAGVGFMVWLWISAIIVLLGGELNAAIEHQRARDDRPDM